MLKNIASLLPVPTKSLVSAVPPTVENEYV